MPTWDPNSIVDFLKSSGQDSSRTNLMKLAKDNGINNYTGTAAQNTQLLKTLRGQSPTTTNGSLQGTLPPENPTPPPEPNYPTIPQPKQTPTTNPSTVDYSSLRSLPQSNPGYGSISALKDVLSNITKTTYANGPQVSDILQGYSNSGIPLTNPNAINQAINRDTTSRAGAVTDMFNSALTRGTELDKARQETIKNLAPSIFEEMKANPNIPVQDLLVKYAQQYEVDPLTLSSNLIQYKSDREKEDLLTQKANLDLLSSKVNLLKDSGASGEIDIPGIGKVDIQKKGDFSLVQAGNSMYVFDKDTGKVQSTGLNTDQLSSNNILDAIQGLAKGDYQNPDVVTNYLSTKGVQTSPSSRWVVSPDKRDPTKQIMGYDFTNYATDPKWGVGVSNLLNKIPSIKTAADIVAYLQKVSPKSPMIAAAPSIIQIAQQNNIDPKLMLAIMGQESSYGTAGRAVKTFNVANIGNVDSGANTNWGTWENGIQALAKNINQRVVNPKSTTTTNNNINISSTGRQKDDKYQTAAGKMADDYTTASKDFVVQRNAFQSAINTNVNTKNPQDDIALVYAFNKVMDPSSVVRESEFNTAAGASSFLDKLGIKVGKVTSGQILNPTVRQNIINTMSARYKNAEQNQNLITQTYTDRAKQQRIDPTDVVTNYTTIHVRDKKSGQTGTVPLSEYNPNLYERI